MTDLDKDFSDPTNRNFILGPYVAKTFPVKYLLTALLNHEIWFNRANRFRAIRLIFFARTIIVFLKTDNLRLYNIEQQEMYENSLFTFIDFYIIRWKMTIKSITITYPPIVIHKFNALNCIVGRITAFSFDFAVSNG